MKIATYNVNSINARMDNLLAWLNKEQPDIVLLQEIKCEFNSFPFFEMNTAGYEAKILGQKSYNGVAILSRHKIVIEQENIPDFEDENARYLQALITTQSQQIRVVAIYLPNGNPPYNDPSDRSKFIYKLKWMDAFERQMKKLVHADIPVVVGGDYNIILTDQDVYNPQIFKGGALYCPEVVNRFRGIEYQGWFDAFRLSQTQTSAVTEKKDNGYTYWDYGGGAFASDLGLRIDYLLLSPKAADKLDKCWVDKAPRRMTKPSDHAPLIAELQWD